MKNTKKVRDRLGRGRYCSTYTYAMLSIAGILSFLLVWELLIGFNVISGRYLAKPTELVVLFMTCRRTVRCCLSPCGRASRFP